MKKQERQRGLAPNIRFLCPGINIWNVKGRLLSPKILAFRELYLVRSEIEQKMKALRDSNAGPEHPSFKYFRCVDKKLERAQNTLLDLLHESDEVAGKYSNVAIDAAIVIITGGARL